LFNDFLCWLSVSKSCALTLCLHLLDIITQLPSNLVITKVKPSVYIGVVTAAWGVVSMCQAFTHNFAGLFISRFILGLVEGPFLPGVFFLMSCWYKRSELPPRIALLYGANMLASAFGGLIAAGIVARMKGKMGRPAWVSMPGKYSETLY
jgi:MFS family permease